jgi:N-acetylglucosaminyl-diphospho-decaprenol L-rhamnosyltransferase
MVFERYSAVIIEFHSGDYLFKCIDSLMKQDIRPTKIVVVNNGTSKNTLSRLQDIDIVQTINPSQNLGYAKAANLGINNTDTQIVATLNPDIILESDCASYILETMSKDSKVGAVGPLIYETDETIYPSARINPSLKIALGHAVFSLFTKDNKYTRKYLNADIDKSRPSQVDWLSGAAIFLNRDALNASGMWDERYFMYCEDIDLCNTLNDNGYRCIYDPRAKIIHKGAVSTSSMPIKLLVQHHKSLFLYSQKKYRNKPILKILAMVFIALRLPLAIVKKIFHID